MTQYTFIDEKHRPTLQAISKNKNVGGDAVLAAIYKSALELLNNPTQIPDNPVYMLSKIVDGDMTVVTSTHAKLGVYVQLAKKGNESGNGLITVGQKFAIQRKNPASSTIETLMF